MFLRSPPANAASRSCAAPSTQHGFRPFGVLGVRSNPSVHHDKCHQLQETCGWHAQKPGSRGTRVIPEAGGGRSSARPEHRATDGRRRRKENEVQESDERGWWEVPEERNLQAYAVEALEPWQSERLEQAYALEGRRKMKIQAIAEELGLDRGRVLAWIKEFSSLPSSERDAIVARLRSEAEQQSSGTKAPANTLQQQASEATAQLEDKPESQGFIPYYTRKEMGALDGRKRLPAEVTRTLESIYRRSSFPSDDMVKAVWDLHRVKRDIVLEWFKQRRDVDGISSSTQKRRERPRGGSASVYIQGDDDGIGSGPRGQTNDSGGERDMLMSLMGSSAQNPQEEQKIKVVKISRAEMAAMKSSLPSRKKQRGRKLAEKMGVKMDEEDNNVLQIGDTRFVTESIEQAAVTNSAKWTQAWRFRRSSAAPPSSINLKRGTKET